MKYRRLVIGLSSKALSRILEHSDGYISVIENNVRSAPFPPHEYPKLAKALEWTTHDLLPPDGMDQASDGTLVDKVVLSLTHADDTRRVVLGMIDYGVFAKPKTFDDLVRYLYISTHQQAEEMIAVLRQVLDGLVAGGKLKVDGNGDAKIFGL